MYPWKDWFHIPEGSSEGATYTFTRGIHFKTTLDNFRCRAFITSHQMGLFLRTRVLVTGKVISITAYRKTSALDKLEEMHNARQIQ
jgi:hypothetical protein